MAKTTVRVEGLQELQRRLRALGAEIEQRIAFGAVLAGANLIKKEAIALAPVAAGNLKRNIVNKRVPKGQRQMTAEYVVTVRGKEKHDFASRYGAIQEFGSVKQPPQPFMRPAFEREKGFAVAKIKEVLLKRIAKAEAGS